MICMSTGDLRNSEMKADALTSVCVYLRIELIDEQPKLVWVIFWIRFD